jgi:zinc transporter, ZIP family
MEDVFLLLLAGSATAFATGLGAIPVFFLGARAERLRPALWGVAAGVMTVASVAGLLLPALDEGSAAKVAAGVVLGVAFLGGTRTLLRRHDPHPVGLRGAGVRTAFLVFIVLFVHSLPEGFAIGTAYASDTAGLGLFVIVAIAAQNVPEGTSVAIPMQSAGFSRSRQFWAAVATSAPQPVGAVVAYLMVQQIRSLLPISFGFAAGAMLTLVAVELVPAGWTTGRPVAATIGATIGAGTMLALSLALGIEG